MRTRGLSTLAVIGLSLLAGVFMAVMVMDWAWIDVRTFDQGEQFSIKLPIPISLVTMSLHFMPDEEFPSDIPPELTEHKDSIMKCLETLADCPDVTLLTVDSPEAKVTVRKEHHKLIFDVVAEDAVVRGSVPIRPIYRALDRWDWKTMDPDAAAMFLSALSKGTRIHVDTPEAKVKIIL